MHSHRLFFILAAVFIALIFQSCKPEACFVYTTSSYGYSPVRAGDVIQFNSCNDDNDEVEWDFGDGIKAYDSHVEHVYYNPGTYVVEFTVRTGMGGKDTKRTTLQVLPANGSVTFWKSNSATYYNIIVEVIGTGNTAYIQQHYSAAPGCNASGCATFSLPPGTYNWEADYPYLPQQITGQVTIESNGCVMVKVE